MARWSDIFSCLFSPSPFPQLRVFVVIMLTQSVKHASGRAWDQRWGGLAGLTELCGQQLWSIHPPCDAQVRRDAVDQQGGNARTAHLHCWHCSPSLMTAHSDFRHCLLSLMTAHPQLTLTADCSRLLLTAHPHYCSPSLLTLLTLIVDCSCWLLTPTANTAHPHCWHCSPSLLTAHPHCWHCSHSLLTLLTFAADTVYIHCWHCSFSLLSTGLRCPHCSPSLLTLLKFTVYLLLMLAGHLLAHPQCSLLSSLLPCFCM